ncbi:MAG: polysaccharide pyruvyl transferase family protein [Clostridia bacterium]|nr:polysaccharide pyruvyl transferase family protein [Clostridia bacterium]
MKTGIITFPTAINYGTALQAAALGNALASYGNDVSFLDHRCPLIDQSNSIFNLSEIFDIKYTLAHLINLDVSIKRKQKFKSFQKKYIPLAEDNPDAYDVLVAGSDQIWNYNLTDDDFYYFLDFKKNNNKKVSYAGSFGIAEVDEKYHQKLKRLFLDFDHISVREKQAANIINNIAGIDVPVVVDPTLLLNKSQWEEMAKGTSSDSKYIFVYTVFNDEKLWDFAEKLSKDTGLPIKTISYSKLHRHNAIYDYTAGPSEWLGYIKDADYVVTNSFHGVAFSINFKKNFFFNIPANAKSVGSRLLDITNRYGFESRNLSGKLSFELNFEKCDALLEQDRIFSHNFIKSFLNIKSNGSD